MREREREKVEGGGRKKWEKEKRKRKTRFVSLMEYAVGVNIVIKVVNVLSIRSFSNDSKLKPIQAWVCLEPLWTTV